MIEIERVDPDDRATCNELAAFLVEIEGEGVSPVPIDPVAAAGQVWLALKEGNSWVARINDKIVGTLVLVERKHWQNPAYADFVSMVFFVGRQHRFSLVGRKLLYAARDMAEPHDKAVFIEITNSARAPKMVENALHATMVGFIPYSHVMRLRKTKVKWSDTQVYDAKYSQDEGAPDHA